MSQKLSERVGGSSFLETRSLLLLAAPLSFITSLFSWETSTALELSSRVFGNLVAFLVLFGFIYWFARWRAASRKPVVLPTFSVLLISFLLGGLKSAITNLGASVVTGVFPDGLVVRILLGAVAGFVLLPLLSLAVSTLADLERDRQLLMLAEYRSEREKFASKREQTQLTQLKEQLASVLLALRNPTASIQVGKAELRLLQEIVEKQVRPLSQSLYEKLEKSYPSFELRSLLPLALSTPPPAWALALNHVIALPYSIAVFGFWTGVGHALTTSALLFVLFFSSYWLLAQSKKLNPVSFGITAVLVGITSVAIASWVFEVGPEFSGYLILMAALWYLQSAVLFSVISVARSLALSNQQRLEERFGPGGVADGELAQLENSRREFANQLHGEIQSRLMRVILATEAKSSLTREQVITELELVSSLLENTPASEPVNLNEKLVALKERWSGLAQVTYELDEDAIGELDPQHLFLIIEQGLTNSFRHGLADAVNVSLRKNQSGKPVLEITDNGVGPTESKPGLGSKLFQSHSSRWELVPNEHGGSVLRLEF